MEKSPAAAWDPPAGAPPVDAAAPPDACRPTGRAPSLLVDARLPDQEKTDLVLGAAVRAAGADYVSAYRLLCASDATPCLTTVDDVPVQWDYGHLTAQGSRFLARKLRQSGVLSLPAARPDPAAAEERAQ